MLDEAHERTIDLDVIMGLFKQFALSRKDIRLVVTSATICSEQYVKFFSAAQINCEQTLFPIEFAYTPVTLGYKYYMETVHQAQAVVADRLAFLQSTKPPGESEIILVFLADMQQIHSATFALQQEFQNQTGQVEIAGMYGALPHEEQAVIMRRPAKPGCVKVVFATNVAETSITFDRVMNVIDSGMQKFLRYNPKTGISGFEYSKISKNAAVQRAGRTGRQGPGKCYRMYTEGEYYAMNQVNQPAILLQNIGSLLLWLMLNSTFPHSSHQ